MRAELTLAYSTCQDSITPTLHGCPTIRPPGRSIRVVWVLTIRLASQLARSRKSLWYAMTAMCLEECSSRFLPQYLIMNLGISENFGTVDFTDLKFPTHMSVDWIRVYQRPDDRNVGVGQFPLVPLLALTYIGSAIRRTSLPART